MNYWLFLIMYDWYPESWPRMVNLGVAAQHYPPGWGAEMRNLHYLGQMKSGDKVVAALKEHRFAGFGTLTSDLYRGGPSLQVDEHEFQERFDCNWSVLPLDAVPPYVELHDLKTQGLDIDLIRGLSIRKIDRRAFDAIRTELRNAGAKPLKHPSPIMPHFASDVKKPSGKGIVTVRAIRDTLHTHELKKAYDHSCQVCGQKLKLGKDYLYAEVHHIKPLCKPHFGRDVESNMLVLCPNHHAMFDLGVPRFINKQCVQIAARKSRLILRHELDAESLAYYNTHVHWNS